MFLYIEQGFDQGFEAKIRLHKVNTPEPRGTEALAGEWVSERVKEWLGDDDIWLKSIDYDRDRYGRIVGDIYKTDGESLATWLIVRGFGWLTDDDGKLLGNRDITSLNIPKSIKDQVLINQRG
jgi:endonuclease YncB( thermonuclease family)